MRLGERKSSQIEGKCDYASGNRHTTNGNPKMDLEIVRWDGTTNLAPGCRPL
jgi:hypothetical protein